LTCTFTVLFASNHNLLSRYTPYVVGALYAILITVETPLSGMSMNPARTFGSAFWGHYWRALWLYFLAPTLGMLIAAEFFLRLRRGVGPYCAKLNHANDKRCNFPPRHAAGSTVRDHRITARAAARRPSSKPFPGSVRTEPIRPDLSNGDVPVITA